jgi:cell division septation protein DedD
LGYFRRMIKYLFIVINSIVLFFYGLFSGDNGISVTGKIPASMIAGQPVAIEIIVNKGAMNGFAKLQLDLPEGFEVKEADEKGANYSYANGIAKWVWAVLPMESEIVVRLTILPSESTLGPKTIAAKYSYVENNVKQVVEMTPAEITVLAPGSQLLSSETPTQTPTEAIAKDSAVTPVPVATLGLNEPPGDITAKRRIEKGTSPNERLVFITIKKGITRGFARYSDDLPAGVIVKGAKTDGASFSVADGKIKFVWVSVPEKEELEISYSMASSISQTIDLQGEYSYLEDNQSKKFKLESEAIIFEAADAIAKTENIEEPKEPLKPQEPPIVKVEEPAAKDPPVKKKTETVFEKKEGKLEFLVQVGAFSRIKVTTRRLEKKFKINEAIRSEMMGGYTKFMVGSHSEYKSARDHRTAMVDQNGVKSAFVVSYNHGKRVTVQEALMITNQKWFK